MTNNYKQLNNIADLLKTMGRDTDAELIYDLAGQAVGKPFMPSPDCTKQHDCRAIGTCIDKAGEG